jgi:hypothetical protein
MTIDDFVARLVIALERAEIPYMLTGSYASSMHGTPRATNDVDVVIAPTKVQLWELMREFPSDRYYSDEDDAFDALERQSLFNVVDFATGWKADLIIRKDRPFSEAEFMRRRPHDIGGAHVYVATAEDILIAKMEWHRMGESERQLDDAAGIIRRQGPSLDRRYVEQWVRELALEEEWRKALERAG